MIEAVPDIDEDTQTSTVGSPAEPLLQRPALAEPAPAESSPAEPDLSERDAAVLDFEKQWWKYAGAKEQAVRELFDLSATQYYQVLNTLIDSPAALAAEPMLVKRLRRMRATRQRERTQRRSQV